MTPWKLGNGQKLFFTISWKIYCLTRRRYSPPKKYSPKTLLYFFFNWFNQYFLPNFRLGEEARLKFELILLKIHQDIYTSTELKVLLCTLLLV